MHHEEISTLESLLEGKVVVADTSSLLAAGTYLLSRIHDCELVIPSIVVQELEAKRGHPTLGALARQWINLLEDIRMSHGIQLSKGVPLDEHPTVTLRVEPNHRTQKSLPEHLQDGSNDSTILAVCRNLESDSSVTGNVVLLSNDTPMRLHATLDLNMDAYEFNNADQNKEKPYTARTRVTLSQEEYVDLGLASGNSSMLLKDVLAEKAEDPLGVHTLIDVYFEDQDEPVKTLRLENGELHAIEHKQAASKIEGRTLEQDVAFHYLKESSAKLPIVSIVGPAGTGKTLLTLATAIEAVKERKYQKIVVFRSLHEMGRGQEMGFLPGDVDAKMGPWGGAIGDALDVIAEGRKPIKKNENAAAVENRKKYSEQLAEMIEVSPITYLRGRSLSRSFIILDEAQNFSRTELLNIISRVGEGSKLVILSDPFQVDNRFLQSGDKADIWSVIRSFKNEDIFAHVTLRKTERSRLAELASAMLAQENGI